MDKALKIPGEQYRRWITELSNRYQRSSEEQAKLMSAGIQYSLRVDTSKLSPDECAAAMLKDLF